MQLALNYSPQAADLLRSGAIALDRFKCPDWPDLIATARDYAPVYVHFDLRADPGLNGALDVEGIAQLRAQTNTPYVNVHLSPSFDDFPEMPLDTTDREHITAVTDTMMQGVLLAIEHFGADHVIVENVPYYGLAGEVMRPAVEPEVIRRIVNETGCGFLLDISHGRLSALHMGIDAYEYLAQMPCDRLREVHMTGLGRNPQGRICDHLGITSADWPFLEWALARIRSGAWARPWALAFEYGGIGPLFEWRSQSDIIAEQVPRLYASAHAL